MKEFVEKLIGRLEEATYDMEICEEQFDMNSPYFMDVDYKMVKFDDAKTIINELAEEYNNGWIPCSERLLDDFMSIEYLATTKACFYPKINYYCVANHKWYSNRNSTKEIEVIAWMPLPAPYKPKE